MMAAARVGNPKHHNATMHREDRVQIISRQRPEKEFIQPSNKLIYH